MRDLKVFLISLLIAILVILSGGCSEQVLTEDPVPKGVPGVQMSEKNAFAVIEETGAEEWDLLLTGDTLCKDFGPKYGEYLSEDLGIDINLLKRYRLGETSTDLLVRIRSDMKFREAIREAEVIVITIPFGWYKVPFEVLIDERIPSDLEGLSKEECIERSQIIVQTDMDAILMELNYLTGSDETLIRIVDSYVAFASYVDQVGVMEQMSIAYKETNEYVESAALQYNIPTVQVFDMFMGESGIENPVDAGLTVGLYPTEKGAEVIAQMLRELGYFYGP